VNHFIYVFQSFLNKDMCLGECTSSQTLENMLSFHGFIAAPRITCLVRTCSFLHVLLHTRIVTRLNSYANKTPGLNENPPRVSKDHGSTRCCPPARRHTSRQGPR
jgi:hypothetical protein